MFIGAGVSLVGNRIGGNNQNNTGPPNSNYFPRIINSTTQEIEPFPNYFSVWNESENQIDYFNYFNENLGRYFPDNVSTSNHILPVTQTDITITRKNLEDWCKEVPSTATQPNWKGNGQVTFNNSDDCREMELSELATLKGAQLIPNKWVLACDGGALDNIAFPIPSQRPAQANEETILLVNALQENKPYLGQSIPNPSENKVTIPIMLPVIRGTAFLEVFDLSSGKAITSKPIPSFGQHLLEIDIHSWSSGIYGYRIVLNEGNSPAPRKMVVLH